MSPCTSPTVKKGDTVKLDVSLLAYRAGLYMGF